MTTAQELLRAIRQSGATVVVEDGSLRIKAPAGRISPEDRQIIAEYKAEILSLLAEEDQAAATAQIEQSTTLEIPESPSAQIEQMPTRTAGDPAASVEIQQMQSTWEIPKSEVRTGDTSDNLSLAFTDSTATKSGKNVTDTMSATFADAIEIPDPCNQCGGLWHWWDLLGGSHCMKCEPATRSDLLAAKATRLRRRAGRSISHAALANVGPDRLTCRGGPPSAGPSSGL